MKDLTTIRKELQEVKLYYRTSELYARETPNRKIVFTESLMKIVRSYDKYIQYAPIRLRLAYENLYHRFKTQKRYAEECDVTEKYIQILNKRIILFFQKCFNEDKSK